jgi:cytosine/adenosine deaminase-related metal-dependent hydrolase
MSARRTLIRGGYILSMDPTVGDLETGDILIEGAVISEIGPSLDSPADEVVDATGMIVMPGLIDSHTHLWHSSLRGAMAGFWGMREYFDTFVLPIRPLGRPQDVYAGTFVGAKEFLANGVTTVVDFCHSIMTPEHADAGVRGLAESGIRGIWAYSCSGSQGAGESFDVLLSDAERIRNEHFSGDNELLDFGMSLSNAEKVSAENRREIEYARHHGLQMVTHSTAWPNHIQSFADEGLLGPDLIFAHANLASDVELQLLAEHGSTITTSMQGELALGYSTTVLRRAIRAGVRVTNSIDSVLTINPDLLGEARATYLATRDQDGRAERDEGRLAIYRRPNMPFLNARDVLALITSEAARALGKWDTIGSLAPGKAADILMLSTEPFGRSCADAASHVVTQATVADVDTVMVAGTFHKRAGVRIDFDPNGVYELNREAQRHYLSTTQPGTLPSYVYPGGGAVRGDR